MWRLKRQWVQLCPPNLVALLSPSLSPSQSGILHSTSSFPRIHCLHLPYPVFPSDSMFPSSALSSPAFPNSRTLTCRCCFLELLAFGAAALIVFRFVFCSVALLLGTLDLLDAVLMVVPSSPACRAAAGRRISGRRRPHQVRVPHQPPRCVALCPLLIAEATLRFTAETLAEREQWVEALEKVVGPRAKVA
jgi:hypothetical protein